MSYYITMQKYLLTIIQYTSIVFYAKFCKFVTLKIK